MKDFVSVFLILVGLLGAFMAGRKFPDARQEAVAETHIEDSPAEKLKKCEDDSEALKKKLGDLTEADLDAIAEAQDAAIRQEKIEKLLSKVVQLFITDLGLRIQNPMLNKPVTVAAAPVVAAAAPVEAVPAAANTPDTNAAAPAPEQKAKPKRKKDFIVRIANAITAQEAKENLSGLARDNIFEDLKAGQPITNTQIRNLIGKFSGKLIYSDGSGEEKISVELRNGSRSGDYRYLILRQGKTTARNSGSGNLKTWLGLEGEIYLPLGTSFFAVVYNHNLDTWFGTYYRQLTNAQYKPVGLVVLNREAK